MKECRTTLMLGVLSVMASELTSRHQADTNPAGDDMTADVIAAVARLLATPGPWGELILVTHDPVLAGHIAAWGSSIDDVAAVGACHYTWLNLLTEHVYRSGYFAERSGRS